MDKKKKIKVGIAGNPNSGKTSIFNNLTGANQHVGNWAGVTVEKKVGIVEYGDYTIEFVDLPGTYSLSARSMEEIVARSFILNEGADLILNVIDASNMERNLFLTTQLIELGAKPVIALNMIDVAKERKINIDSDTLSRLVGAPVVETIGRHNKGTKEILTTIVKAYENDLKNLRHIHVNYGKYLESGIEQLKNILKNDKKLFQYTYECGFENNVERNHKFPIRWFCTRLIAGEERIIEFIKYNKEKPEKFLENVTRIRKDIEKKYGGNIETYLADCTYSFINGLVKEVIDDSKMETITYTERIDSILINRILGLPILMVVIWAMFQFTFKGAELLTPAIQLFFDFLKTQAGLFLGDGILKSLVVNGIIDGVGNVIIFLPSIALLFLCIAFLEDSGYMARAAFIMDRFMHFAGLHGKSFIALFMGFGCNAPAVMACRTLENKSDRIITMLIIPLMSCSARFPIYILFAGTFFPEHAGTVVFIIYLIGILLGVIVANIFRRAFFKAESSPFVLELPPYRMPNPRSLMMNMWEKSWVFVKKAGTVILFGVVLIWFISSFPRKIELSKNYKSEIIQLKGELNKTVSNFKNRYENSINSLKSGYGHPFIPFKESRIYKETEEYYKKNLKEIKDKYLAKIGEIKREKHLEIQSKRFAGMIGKFMEPALKPLGFDWRVGVSLIPGFVAKEVVVGSFAVLYSGEDDSGNNMKLSDALKKSGSFTPLSAISFMIFSLLYIPCLATVSVIRKESGNGFWAYFAIFYSLILAWSLSFVVYQGGMLLGFK